MYREEDDLCVSYFFLVRYLLYRSAIKISTSITIGITIYVALFEADKNRRKRDGSKLSYIMN